MPARSDLKIVQIFYMALRNNISLAQVYIPISICIQAWAVITFPSDKLLGGNGGMGGMLKQQLTPWFQVRAGTVLLASLFLSPAINPSAWGHSLQPFPLIITLPSHISPGP